MRNILVFPNGTYHHFMYPINRDVVIDEKLQIQMQDDSTHIMKIVDIQKKEKEVLYFLSF